MIDCVSTTYRRGGKLLCVEFNRENGFWGADLWNGGEYLGSISNGRSTSLDVVVQEAGAYMEKHHPYVEEPADAA